MQQPETDSTAVVPAAEVAIGAGGVGDQVAIALTDLTGRTVRAEVPAVGFAHVVAQLLSAYLIPTSTLPDVADDGTGWLTTPDGRLVTRTGSDPVTVRRDALEQLAALHWLTGGPGEPTA